MELWQFFKENSRIALAFSGGTDSAYLLYSASKYADDVTAYYVKSAFQPEFEFEDAKRLAKELNVKLKVIELDVLSDNAIASNPPDRCYYCKKRIFSNIVSAAKADGYEVLIDGTNASDAEGERPGMRALREIGVRSPLRECGITKADVRRLSKEAGLFTADKPSYACLATRIPSGVTITKEDLKITEAAEEWLKSLGFEDFRVRMGPDRRAVLQLKLKDMERLMSVRTEVLEKLKEYYKSVTLDLEERI